IIDDEEMIKRSEFIDNPRAIIHYSVYSTDEELLKTIGRKLKEYLVSKGYEAIILLLEISDYSTDRDYLTGSVITSANLNPD
ncbi:MAG: hypothetical protein ACTSSC_11995, partial [Promethearchaeota archaeon]